MNLINKCYCGNPKNFCCRFCKKKYCSKNCQKNDWNIHKNICSIYKIINEVVDFSLTDERFNQGCCIKFSSNILTLLTGNSVIVNKIEIDITKIEIGLIEYNNEEMFNLFETLVPDNEVHIFYGAIINSQNEEDTYEHRLIMLNNPNMSIILQTYRRPELN